MLFWKQIQISCSYNFEKHMLWAVVMQECHSSKCAALFWKVAIIPFELSIKLAKSNILSKKRHKFLLFKHMFRPWRVNLIPCTWIECKATLMHTSLFLIYSTTFVWPILVKNPPFLCIYILFLYIYIILYPQKLLLYLKFFFHLYVYDAVSVMTLFKYLRIF